MRALIKKIDANGKTWYRLHEGWTSLRSMATRYSSVEDANNEIRYLGQQGGKYSLEVVQ